MERFRILVISDTHGSRGSIERALGMTGGVDALFHLGDYASDMEGFELGIPVLRVSGGVRDEAFAAELIEIALGGKRIVAVHGQNHQVMYTKSGLIRLAESRGADIVLYGHTHRPVIKNENGILLINPGSAIMPRGGAKAPSFATLNIDGDGEIDAEIVYLK